MEYGKAIVADGLTALDFVSRRAGCRGVRTADWVAPALWRPRVG